MTEKRKNLISKEVSTKLKGLAILFVLLGHVLNYYFGSEISSLSAHLGTGGVWIFLILSGYGLYASYEKKGIQTGTYWRSKGKNIFLPYGIVTIIYYVIIRIAGKTVNFQILLKNLVCMDFERNIDGTMWYMSFLLLWYVVFFGIFIFKVPDVLKIAGLFVVAYFFSIGKLSGFWKDCNWQFSINAYAFPAGVLISYLSKKIDIGKVKKEWKIGGLAVAVLLYAAGVSGLIGFTYGHYGILLFITCWITTELIKINCLNLVGKHSYFIYLVEGKLITLLAMINYGKYSWMFAVAFVLGIVVTTIIYENITKIRVLDKR